MVVIGSLACISTHCHHNFLVDRQSTQWEPFAAVLTNYKDATNKQIALALRLASASLPYLSHLTYAPFRGVLACKAWRLFSHPLFLFSLLPIEMNRKSWCNSETFSISKSTSVRVFVSHMLWMKENLLCFYPKRSARAKLIVKVF